MSIVLGFLPFIVFAVLERLAPLPVALAAAALVASAACWRERSRGEPLKILDIGALIIFLSLAVATTAGIGTLPVPVVRLAVDLGLVLIAAVSLLIRSPFTLAYTPGQMPAEARRKAVYMRTHTIVTAVWTAAFLASAAADALMIWVAAFPLWAAVALTVAALTGAVIFTRRYPARVRARFAAAAAKEG